MRYFPLPPDHSTERMEMWKVLLKQAALEGSQGDIMNAKVHEVQYINAFECDLSKLNATEMNVLRRRSKESQEGENI